MELSVLDRLLLLRLLPVRGSLITLRVVSDLRRDLGFSEEELAYLDLREDAATQQIRWNAENEQPREIEIGERGREIIAKALRDLDAAEQLEAHHLTLWERFVEIETVGAKPEG